jgi:hypothetical protein
MIPPFAARASSPSASMLARAMPTSAIKWRAVRAPMSASAIKSAVATTDECDACSPSQLYSHSATSATSLLLSDTSRSIRSCYPPSAAVD